MKKLFKAGQEHFEKFQGHLDKRTPPIPPNKPSFLGSSPSSAAAGPPSGGIQPASAKDILRYRYHHGTNLGAIYVLEKWLKGSMFPNDCGGDQSSELEAVKLSVKEHGVDTTREKWEQHWRAAIGEDDWNWLANTAHCIYIYLVFVHARI
jgi:hypothetical protein